MMHQMLWHRLAALLSSLLFFTTLVLTGLFSTVARADFEAATSPFSVLQSVFTENWTTLDPEGFARAPQNVVSALDYLRSHVAANDGLPDYDRSTDFGSWAYPDPSSCQNTRARVLLRDADTSQQIKYTNAKECSVLTGLWHDPYTGGDFAKARELDIDHVVPLHTAWLSGAHAWDSARRCHYANFMHNAIHLLPVSSQQNRSKGDKGPDGYMPADPKNACHYLGIWAKIKTIWELSATPREVAAIEQLFTQNHCSANEALVSTDELLDQRKASLEPIPACAEFFASGHMPRPGPELTN